MKKWVRPQDGNITINICDAWAGFTGGFIKSSVHRVHVPPADQTHVDRLGPQCFLLKAIQRPINHVVFDRLQNSALLDRLGLMQNVFTDLDQHLTTEEWVKVRHTQQQCRNKNFKVSKQGKNTSRPEDLEISRR
ncbi:naringenin 2-oxoglutarate 3-dioxygenase [Penicillium sp. IBT 18751x]|nr:naringenin 2-oxoglutarate 3-dioxygenase [Penicillium sp. IBT 18751x]